MLLIMCVNFLAFIWTSFFGIFYADNCVFKTVQSEKIEIYKNNLDCLKRLRESELYTHYDRSNDTCSFKKGYVSPFHAVASKDKFCAYHPEKLLTNNIIVGF